MNKININFTPVSCFDGLAVKTGLFTLMLLTAILLLPSTSQADGLFDFQMKLAEKGNAEAQFKVGEMYETGFGVKKNMTEARNWINKSAAQGNEAAGYKLLYWDVEKNGLKGGNKEKVAALQAKAKEGNPQAQYYVGKMQAYGVGLKKNTDAGLKWLNKAAFVGVLEAEREAVIVKENKVREDAAAKKKRAEDKKRAEQKARQQREKQAKLEEQRKLEAKKQAEQKARADSAAKQNKAAEQQRLSAQNAQKQAEQQAKLKAQQDAARKREAEKQALLKKRAEEEKSRKAEFESDPCSGKSARFLSTCK